MAVTLFCKQMIKFALQHLAATKKTFISSRLQHLEFVAGSFGDTALCRNFLVADKIRLCYLDMLRIFYCYKT